MCEEMRMRKSRKQEKCRKGIRKCEMKKKRENEKMRQKKENKTKMLKTRRK